jgi:hypothetical protein
MQALDQGQGFEVVRLDVIETGLTLGRLNRFRDGLHHDAPVGYVLLFNEALFPRLVSPNLDVMI